MRILCTLLGVIAVTSVSATGQAVLVPSTALGPFAGTSGNYFTAGGINRFQMIYDTSSLTTQGVLSPINITNVQFLYGGGTTPTNIGTFPSVTVSKPAAAKAAFGRMCRLTVLNPWSDTTKNVVRDVRPAASTASTMRSTCASRCAIVVIAAGVRGP